MKNDELIKKFLDDIESILYLDYSVNDKNIADKLVKILEDEYDI